MVLPDYNNKKKDEHYCPIKTPDGKCGAGGECDRRYCWEKMHYKVLPEEFKRKMKNWESARRFNKKRWEK